MLVASKGADLSFRLFLGSDADRLPNGSEVETGSFCKIGTPAISW
jgi:hypothetical protein